MKKGKEKKVITTVFNV